MKPDSPILAALAGGLLACGAADVTPPRAAPQPPASARPTARGAPSQAFAETAASFVFADPERLKKLESAFPAVDALAVAEIQKQKLPGMVLGVVVDGALVYAKGFGVADLEKKTKPDADTGYRIGSVTKSFTALAVLMLRDEGKLTLDDPLTRFLPEATALVYTTGDAPPLTLRQLLTHTSGLPRLGKFDYTRNDGEPSEQGILESLKGLPLDNAPGTRFVYSNLGYGLLGLVVGRASGSPFRRFMAERFFAPLGMNSTGLNPEAVGPGRLATAYKKGPSGELEPTHHWRLGASEGAGGIYSTLRDMGRYVALQLAAYPPRNSPESAPIRRSSIREAHANGQSSPSLRVRLRDDVVKGQAVVTAQASSYAFAWGLSQTCDFDEVVAHNGAVDGFAANVTLVPGMGVGVVVLANYVHANLDSVADAALGLLKKTGGMVKRVRDPKGTAIFGTAMTRFLRVYDEWSEAAYGEMLAKGRRRLPSEQAELFGYKAFHGKCSGYEPLELLAPHRARFAMQCERGKLEMEVSLDSADHLITGFWGLSREVSAPPKVARVAEGLASLVKRWDEGIYKKHLGPTAKKDPAETAKFFQKLRTAHGSCSVKTFTREPDKHLFSLTCERGGDLKLTLQLDDKNPDVVAGYWFRPETSGACPIQ